jgi:hypothetical protein
VVSAFDEWSDAKGAMKEGSILDAVRFYNAQHLGLPTKLFHIWRTNVLLRRSLQGISIVYRRSLRHYLSWLKRDFGPQPIADITTRSGFLVARSERESHH